MKVTEPLATGWPSRVTEPVTDDLPSLHPSSVRQHVRNRSVRCTVRSYSLIVSPPSMLPSACQAVRLMESATNRTEPSAKEALTPLGCRLRAEFTREVLLPATQGIFRSVLGIVPQ